ncbi:MAG TPA: MBL fold metallo-hydrolase, partial [Thermoanaerobaculia bacterium]
LLFTLHVSAQPSFVIEKVADGVYVSKRTETPGLIFDSNSVFIINDSDVFVVDTNFTLASARANIAELKKLTNKPVRYIVNTHWHDDHITGNAAWRDAYPDLKFIGHTSSREDMKGVGAANRDNLREHLGETINLFKRALADQKNIAGVPITPDERASYLADLSHLERYKDEGRYAEIIPPSVLVDDELSFTRGDRIITIRHLSRAHTGADLIVQLPKENIVITGDLVVWPVPLVGSTSSPASYASTLEKLLAIKPATFIPGHGPVMRDDSYVRSELALLQSLVEQTRAAKASGKSLDETRKVVKLDTFEKTFAGDSKSLAFVFANYVSGSGIAAAYNE